MTTTCPKCGLRYDDAVRLTFCPHDALMSDHDLAQKDAGNALFGKDVRFALQLHGPVHHIRSVGWDGRVTIDGIVGEFAPHLFVVVDNG
jgi:hypothetical protein